MPHTKVTLADIAKLAGVSTSTVSRALTDSPQISDAVKRHIKTIAAQHHYQTHLGARNFRLKKSHVAALVLPIDASDGETLSNPFVLEFIGTIGAELRRVGYNLLLLQDKRADQQFWESGLVEGFIQLGHGLDLDRLNDLPPEMPFVVWGPKLANQRYCTVGIDNLKLAQQAVEHLIHMGRRRIGIITGTFGQFDTESYLRFEGYREALDLAGIPFDQDLVTYANFESQSGYQAAAKLYAQAPDMDAVFAAHSDVVALTAIEALRERGRVIPDDVAVIGFDNIALGSHFGLPLTTVSQEVQTTGARALVDALMRQIAGETVHPVILEGKLIIRQSCGADQ